jgi:hypothetical protein
MYGLQGAISHKMATAEYKYWHNILVSFKAYLLETHKVKIFHHCDISVSIVS